MKKDTVKTNIKKKGNGTTNKPKNPNKIKKIEIIHEIMLGVILFLHCYN